MGFIDPKNTDVAVENRLIDVVGEDLRATERRSFDNNTLRELKGAILSIDWEISDAILANLIEITARLEETFRQAKDPLLMIKLIGSLGKYIRKNKANSDPGAIRLLNSTYSSLEKMLSSKDLADSKKRQLLLAQVEEFKKLKENITQKKAAGVKTKDIKPIPRKETVGMAPAQEIDLKGEQKLSQKPGAAHVSEIITKEPLDQILQEIRHCIQTEFAVLREELVRLMNKKG